MFEHSEDINDLGAALCKAQASLSHAHKDAANPFFKSTYATLASVWDACREALTGNGISVAQSPETDEKGMLLRTTLIHQSGQWMSSVIPLCGGLKNMQELGSALSYARRYGLASMVGVCPADDDDGNAASGRTEQQSRPAAKQPKPEPSRVPEPKFEGPTFGKAPIDKPLPQPEMDEAEKWVARLDEMLEARQFDTNAKARAKAAICRKFKTTALFRIPAESRGEIESKINDGSADRYKNNGKETAAA